MRKKEKIIKDIAASIRARLLNIAKASGRDFNAVLLQFFQERFLYRISVSPYNDQFILKGALLFIVHDISRFRPTKDIDFLGKFNPNDIEDIIVHIGKIPSEEGVVFDVDFMCKR
ncbi:MAG: nucleotidyl transferase AbiEii/AbiGii toxin family protein [Calditrichales bacterium]|nr:nucleotidyl transferase AbiEii/AbiGii toxin family protein [Calditrichales bacterium]